MCEHEFSKESLALLQSSGSKMLDPRQRIRCLKCKQPIPITGVVIRETEEEETETTSLEDE